MGVQISDIIPRKEIELSDLKGKTISVDAFNTLYQFLTTIRQQDGTPLMDLQGNITSHLSGLLYRNINLLAEGIKLIYVFDGVPPELKLKEIEERKKAKEVAREKYEEAKEKEDEKEMKKYAGRDVKLTKEIIEESKELLYALGIAVVQSESEGEAEAAQIARKKLSWASASQDYDSLLFGTPRLIRNLTLSRKRKTSSGAFVETSIELIELEEVLKKLDITQDQLLCLAILVGTDYNPKGVRGIGQKRALEIVQKYKTPEEIFNFVESSEKYFIDFTWKPIFDEFKEFKSITTEKTIEPKIDKDKIIDILVNKHDFAKERIDSALEKLKVLEETKKQKGLNEFW